MILKILNIKIRNYLILILLLMVSNPVFGYENNKKFKINFLKGGMKNGYYLSGIEIQLFNEWKTYWKYPGPAGVKPKIEIIKKINIENVEILWPIPQRIDLFDTSFYGYKENLIIPIKIIPENKKEKSFLDLRLDIGFCKQICIMENLSIQTKIDHFETNILEKYKIDKFLKRVPQKLNALSKKKIKCKKINLKNDKYIKYEIEKNNILIDYDFAILEFTQNNFFINKQESKTSDNKIVLTAELDSNFISQNENKKIILIAREKGIIIDNC